jgi:hypothetical protein
MGLGAPAVVDLLSSWAAELRADAAAASRRRERWLRRQSGEESRFAGALTDLAERGSPIVAHTRGGTRIRGRIVCVGDDFLGLATEQRATQLVRIEHITAVRSNATDEVVSDRSAEIELDMDEAIRALADERPRVRLTLGLSESVTGELRGVGIDVASVRLEGDQRSTLYVRLAAISELVVV